MGILNRSLNLIFCMKLMLLKRNGSPKEKILDLVLNLCRKRKEGPMICYTLVVLSLNGKDL
jgi:hypothetical protein